MELRAEGPASAPLRVIIADDDPLARRVVRDQLQDAGIVVIAEAADGHDAIQLCVHYQPEVVLMDVVMPGIDGIAATKEIVKQVPGIAVVVLSANEDDELGLVCLRSGASGFLSKTVSLESLPQALHAARRGEAVVSRGLTMRLIEQLRRRSPDGLGMRPVRSPLTSREWEVLDLLCQRCSTDEIADALVLSAETVRSHVKNILRKLGVRSRQEAVDMARQLRSDSDGSDLVAA